MRIYCGIDPGFTGAIAFIDQSGELVQLVKMPVLKIGKNQRVLDESAIRELMHERMPCFVTIEKAQSMPKQGVVGVGRYMEGYGFLRGLFVGLDIPYQAIAPTRWKRAMMPDMPKEKSASVLSASRMFPCLTLKPTEHGKADALLIAVYGFKMNTYVAVGSGIKR